MMRSVVCFGDSNTWGSIPGGLGRHAWSVRWPGVLQQQLGQEFRIIEEGLGGRTTCWDDPLDPGRNGRSYLPLVLETHSPIDVLVIMLGTNDVKARFNLSAFSIGQGAAELLQLATRFEPTIPNVLLMSPPHIVETSDTETSLAFAGAIEKSRELAQHYGYFCRKHNRHFVDCAKVAETSAIDGIHLDAEAHRRIAHAVAGAVRKMIDGELRVDGTSGRTKGGE